MWRMKPKEGTGMWQSTRESGQQVPTFSIMQATWPDTKDVLEGKTKQKNLATKRQRKLLTGSHGNRGATDNALPRKAVRLRRKAPPFNLPLLSFVASPSDSEWWCLGMGKMSVGWIIKSWACWSRWNINSHGNVSVIEKVNEKPKDKKKIARGWGHLGVCWDWQKEKHWQHTLLCAGGHDNMSRFLE